MSLSAFDQWAMLVLWGIYTIAWQSSLLIVLVWLTLSVCTKASPRWKHLMWLVVVVRLLLPPLFSLPTSIGNWAPGFWEKLSVTEVLVEEAGEKSEIVHTESSTGFQTVWISANDQGRVVSFSDASENLSDNRITFVEEVREEASEKNEALPVYALLFVLWVCGAAGILGLSLWQTRRFNRMIKSLPQEDDWVKELVKEASCRLGYKGKVTVCYSLGNQSPVVTGLIHPRIVLSSDLFEHLTREEIYSVLLHEIAHLKRKDHWVVVLQVIAKAIHFYHPLVWVFMAMMDRERECDCDDAVLSINGIDKSIYATSLNRVLSYLGQPSRLIPGMLGMAEVKSQVGKRIVRVLKGGMARKRRLGIVSVLFAIVFALVFTSFTPDISAQIVEQKKSEAIEAPMTPEVEVRKPVLVSQQLDDGVGSSLEEAEVKTVSENQLELEQKEINSGTVIGGLNDGMISELEVVEEKIVSEKSAVEQTSQDEEEILVEAAVLDSSVVQKTDDGYVFTDKEVVEHQETQTTSPKPLLELCPPIDDITKRFFIPEHLVDLVSRDLNEVLLSKGINMERVGKYGVTLEYEKDHWYISVTTKPAKVNVVGDVIAALVRSCKWMDPKGRFELRQGKLYELQGDVWKKCDTRNLDVRQGNEKKIELKRVMVNSLHRKYPVYDVHLSYKFNLGMYQYLPRDQWDNKEAFDLNFQVMVEGIKAFLPGYGVVLVHQNGNNPDVTDIIEVIADGRSLNGLEEFLWKWSKSPLFEEYPVVYVCSAKRKNDDLFGYMRSKLPNNRYRLAGRFDSPSVVVACVPGKSDNLYRVAKGFTQNVQCKKVRDFSSQRKEKFEAASLVPIQHVWSELIVKTLKEEFLGRNLVISEVSGKNLIVLQGSAREVQFAENRIKVIDVIKKQYPVTAVFLEIKTKEALEAVQGMVDNPNTVSLNQLELELEELGICEFHIRPSLLVDEGEESSIVTSKSYGLGKEEIKYFEERVDLRVYCDEDNSDALVLNPFTYHQKNGEDSSDIYRSWTVRLMKNKPHLLYIDKVGEVITPESPVRAFLVKVSEGRSPGV